MRTVVNMTGRKFGRLTAIKREGSNADKKALWLCECTCGNKVIVEGRNLRTDRTLSCGCLRKRTR